MFRNPAKAVAVRLLFIVSRTELARYTYLKFVFDSQTGDVVLDRRVGERRWRQKRVGAERRGIDRRQQDITRDLETSGWALVGR